MASGKSDVGKALSNHLQLPFLDLDSEIEKYVGASVPEIFSTKGEIFFRKQEQQRLKELLDTDESYILALGGGTPCYGNAMDLIETTKDAKSIYLKASINTLSERIFSERLKRPLVAHIEEMSALKEFIGIHLFERNRFYSRAHFTVHTDDKTVREVAIDIEQLIRSGQ